MTEKKPLWLYWLAILTLGTTFCIGTISLLRAINVVGSPFSGFFVGPNLLVSIGQRPGWPGIKQGLQSLDQITAVDGATISSLQELHERVLQHQPGESLIYRFVRNGMVRDIGIPVVRYTFADFVIVFLVPFLIGLLFISFGGILYFSQPFARGSFVYLMLCCLIGVICMTLFEAHTTFTFFRIILMYPLIGALSVHLFSLFPEKNHPLARIRILVIGFYLFAIYLALSRQLELSSVQRSALLSKWSSLFVLLVLLTNVFLLIRSYFQTLRQIVRDKIKVIGIGLLIASSFIVAWSINFLLLEKSFFFDEGILLASVFPIFMAYAILRKNIFKLDRVIRLSLSYGVAAALILVLYISVLGAIQAIIPQFFDTRNLGILIVILAGIGAFLFNQLRCQINGFIHRSLFKSHFDLRQSFEKLEQSLVAGLDLSTLAKITSEKLAELFDLEKTAFVCWSPKDPYPMVCQVSRWDTAPLLDPWMAIFWKEKLIQELQEKKQPFTRNEIRKLSKDFAQSFDLLEKNNIELVLPCVCSNTLFGIILLGEKLSKDLFDTIDLDLLRPLATRLAIVLQNAELSAEAGRQARLAALGQMASVLIHDIKNPLATIKISAGSIKKRFRSDDDCFELATFVEEEVDRMNHAVGNILTYAKPSGSMFQIHSLNQIVLQTLDRFKPRFEQAHIECQCKILLDEKPIQADESNLSRALENLLANAIDAMRTGGIVFVQTMVQHKNGSNHMAVSIEDQGKGICESVVHELFRPFFTTKQGGTGLGLSIVKQIVEEHHGSIEFEHGRKQGACFTVCIPIFEMSNNG